MSDQGPSSSELRPLLSEDAFQNEQSRRLFEAIDELRSCGANHEIELPELIIVGDQSAGKSSLLQSLTDIPFPVSDRLCTRFPTRIVSRRTPFQPESIKVSIEASISSAFENLSQQANGSSGFDQTSRLERLDRYAKFARVLPELTGEGFRDILNEAVDLMEIPRPSSLQGQTEVNGVIKPKHNFSNDVLKVEISGPSRSYFSILDLPGIFQSLTKDLTEVEKLGVRNLSTSYMTSKQSVIICVASGTNDVANQAVFDLASEKDPRGDRTLMDLARNTEKYFRHGWFVIRNRTPSEVKEAVKPLERHIRETKFFNSAPWNTLPSERRGTQALKKYLAELLSNRTLDSFPTMLTTLRERIKSTTLRLEGLGSARGTLEEKRAFLTKIAQDFNSLALQALRGRYDLLAASNLKLRRLVREVNDSFSLAMKKGGHSVPFVEHIDFFKSSSSPVRASLPFSKDMAFEEYAQQDGTVREVFQNVYMTGWSKLTSFEELRLSDCIQQQTIFGGAPAISSVGSGSLFKPVSSGSLKFGETKSTENQALPPNTSSGLFSADNFTKDLNLSLEPSGIYSWIALEVQANRGTELQGTFNPDILPALFHKQITKWKAYSESHFLQVTKITVQTLVALLGMVCPDPLVRGRLEKAIRRASDAAEKKGLSQLLDRITTLASAHLQTNNSAFIEKVRVARLQRFQAALERYRSRHAVQPPAPAQSTGFGGGNFGGSSFGAPPPAAVTVDTKFMIDMKDTAILFDELHVSNAQNQADEIHDILKAYYEIARDDFIEYVNHLIVEPYLNDPDGPVMFFAPLYVSAMPPEQLESLAIEPVSLVRERTDLESQLQRLKHAEAIAQKYT